MRRREGSQHSCLRPPRPPQWSAPSCQACQAVQTITGASEASVVGWDGSNWDITYRMPNVAFFLHGLHLATREVRIPRPR